MTPVVCNGCGENPGRSLIVTTVSRGAMDYTSCDLCAAGMGEVFTRYSRSGPDALISIERDGRVYQTPKEIERLFAALKAALPDLEVIAARAAAGKPISDLELGSWAVLIDDPCSLSLTVTSASLLTLVAEVQRGRALARLSDVCPGCGVVGNPEVLESGDDTGAYVCDTKGCRVATYAMGPLS